MPDVFETTPQDQEILDNLSLVLKNSPVKFQVTKPVEELWPSTLHNLTKKVNETQKQSVNKLLEHVAPGQGNLLFPEKNTTINVPLEIEHLYHAFVSSSSNNNNEKCAILSLVQNSYSKREIMKLFNCSRYLLDKAKKAFYFQQINEINFTKSKLDCENTQHFIEFLFSSGAIQEVVYGTTILKFNELESQRIYLKQYLRWWEVMSFVCTSNTVNH